MRQPFAGVAFLIGMLAIAAPAASVHAADHQYFVTSANDDIAALADLGARSRVGDTVSFDLILLRKTSVKVGAVDAYWAEGIQEVDCANHRRRVMLISGLSLDRSAKANQPGANFRDWELNQPGTTGREVEDLVCRNVRAGSIRPVADLTTFQRDYFRNGAQVAAAPSAAPAPAAAAPRPAPQQPGPSTASSPRYVIVGYDKQSAEIFDRGQLKRSGASVTGASYMLQVKPDRMGGIDVYWTDLVKEYDCARHRHRQMITKVLTLDRSDAREAPDGTPFDPWVANEPGSLDADAEALFCTGKIGPYMTGGDDLTALQRSFFAFARSSEPRMAAAPAAPSRPTTAPVARPAAAPAPKAPAKAMARYYVFNSDKETAALVERQDAVRVGEVVTTRGIVLNAKPITSDGKFYWMDSLVQFDCAKHLYRDMTRGLRSLDRSQFSEAPQGKYREWIKVVPDSVLADGEAVMCQDKVNEGVIPVDDLAVFQRQFFAYAAKAAPPAANAAKPSAPTPAAKAGPTPKAGASAKFAPFYITDLDEESADIVDRATAKRAGNVVTATEIVLNYKPFSGGGVVDKYWMDFTVQHDCVQHRSRMMLRSFRTLDRKQSSDDPSPSYDEWKQNEPKTLSAHVEALLCRDVTGDDPTADDLASFQSEYFNFVKGRYGK